MNSEKTKWYSILSKWGLQKFAEDLLEDIYVYSAVPNWAVDSIKKHRLLGGKLISKDEELLKKIHPDEEGREHWLSRMDDPDLKITYEGPNVLFTLPPDSFKLHPIYKDDMTILRINLSEVLKDYPSTKIHGLELIPYSDDKEYEKNKPEIEQELSLSDVRKYVAEESQNQWAKYVGDNYFAGNVPHAVIATPSGKIESKYITWA